MSWRPRWLRDSHTPPQRREDKTGAARRLAKTVSAIRRRSMKSPPEVGREKVRLSTVRVLAGFGIFDPSQEAPGAGLIRAVCRQFRSLRPALRISMGIVDQTPVQTCGHRVFVGFDETCDHADSRGSTMNAHGGFLANTIPSDQRVHSLVKRFAQVRGNRFGVAHCQALAQHQIGDASGDAQEDPSPETGEVRSRGQRQRQDRVWERCPRRRTLNQAKRTPSGSHARSAIAIVFRSSSAAAAPVSSSAGHRRR
jgi:hypothetical protein